MNRLPPATAGRLIVQPPRVMDYRLAPSTRRKPAGLDELRLTAFMTA